MPAWFLCTNLPLFDAAGARGFYDQSHFTKAFKAHTGLPPQAYRRRANSRGRKRSPWRVALGGDPRAARVMGTTRCDAPSA